MMNGRTAIRQAALHQLDQRTVLCWLCYGCVLVLLLLLVSACGAPASSPRLPTAHIVFTPHPPPALRRPTATLAAATAPSQSTDQTPASDVEQYRAWMEEARAQYPYGEPVEAMWALMICESSGDSDVVAGPYQGLFQYTSETWAGEWNLYRDQSIFDPHAQIFATAKAWHDGNRWWWGCQ